MKNRVRQFNNGKMKLDELVKFKEDVNLMTDRQLDQYLNSCEPEFDFSKTEINAIQDRINKDIKAHKRQLNIDRFFKSCAAVLFPAILICGILIFNYHNDIKKFETLVSNKIIIETDKGESSMTILPDGSRINMGPKSSLIYSIDAFNSDTRTINYSGEGHFNICKKPNVPFSLILPDFEIKVLGTVFSLYARENKTNAEIYLEEGALELTSLISNRKELLHSGETAIINNETGVIKIIDDTIKYKRIAGKSTIYFTHTELKDVIKELELYYGFDMSIDEYITNIYFTGSLPTDNLEQALFILENTLNISVSKIDQDNLITFIPKNNNS